MKTPESPTRVMPVKDAAARAPSVAPWGAAGGRVLVEQPASRAAGTVRGQLKARLEVDHPEGKATARRRYFGLQRGLPGDAQVGDAAAAAAVAPKV
jgi:hypothetical protein